MRSLCSLAFLAACTFSAPKAVFDADVGGDGGDMREWVVIDELTVQVNSATAVVTSMVSLQAGVMYRLRASGKFFIALQTEADAEYYEFNFGPARDGEAGIDIGLAVNDPVVDNTRTPRWGSYNASHVYEVEWMGNGAPIVAQLHDGNYTNNFGTLKLEILAFQ